MAEEPEAQERLPNNNKVFAHTLSDAELLRGMQTFEALRSGALVYADAAGSEETWQLSRKVERIRWFISHNWSVSRWAKFGALCLHFNWYPACCVTVIALSLVFVLTALGLLPMVKIYTSYVGDSLTWSGVVAQPIATWVFLVTLFTWHELAGRLGLMQQPVFLDKTCISQTDPELKKKGISSLAGFLSHSDAMLVVYSPVYLQKMWTVYEMATVLILFPEMPVIVMPTLLLPMFVVASLLFYVYYRIVFLWSWQETTEFLGQDNADEVLPLILYFMEFVIVVLMRWAAMKERSIEEDVAAFRIAEAKVFDERDRRPVCASVAHFMRESGRVAPEAPHAACLSAFDELVRESVPQFLQATLRGGMSYGVVVIILLPLAGMAVDKSAAGIYHTEDANMVLHDLLGDLGTQLLIVPSIWRVAALLAHCCLGLRGAANVAYTAAIGFLVASLITGMDVAVQELGEWEEDGDLVDEVIVGVIWFLLLVLTIFLYAPQRVFTTCAAGANSARPAP